MHQWQYDLQELGLRVAAWLQFENDELGAFDLANEWDFQADICGGTLHAA